MIFTETPLSGSFLIEIEPIRDDRGFFARTWCEREFRDRGLNPSLRQVSISFNSKKGTLRGMHYQVGEFLEAKLIRCLSGTVYDVIIDLRRNSPTFAKHYGVVLSSDDRKMLYVPEGYAHGFQTLADNTEICYQISQFYSPEHSRGIRWNDPTFAIQWPVSEPILSPRDQVFPDFDVHSGGL